MKTIKIIFYTFAIILFLCSLFTSFKEQNKLSIYGWLIALLFLINLIITDYENEK